MTDADASVRWEYSTLSVELMIERDEDRKIVRPQRWVAVANDAREQIYKDIRAGASLPVHLSAFGSVGWEVVSHHVQRMVRHDAEDLGSDYDDAIGHWFVLKRPVGILPTATPGQ